MCAEFVAQDPLGPLASGLVVDGVKADAPSSWASSPLAVTIGWGQATAAVTLGREFAGNVVFPLVVARATPVAHHRRGRSVLVIAVCSTGPDAAHHDWASDRSLASVETAGVVV